MGNVKTADKASDGVIEIKRNGTFHKIFFKDARQMAELSNGSVHLVVTSPPYPMVKMWDGLFSKLNPRIGEILDFLQTRKLNYEKAVKLANEAFNLMHETLLLPTWEEVKRVLIDGGIACINVGDATRNLGGIFRLFANHVRTVELFEKLGFVTLPFVLWKKPTNRPNAFLGSGFLPPNAYVTNDVEFILVFRKGKPRKFPPKHKLRYESAYTKEERNKWFSQTWNVRGVRQTHEKLSRRTASFPVEIPLRLIKMFSVKLDTVLDPFVGLGTTTIAAMKANRNSIGYEVDKSLKPIILENLKAQL